MGNTAIGAFYEIIEWERTGYGRINELESHLFQLSVFKKFLSAHFLIVGHLDPLYGTLLWFNVLKVIDCKQWTLQE